MSDINQNIYVCVKYLKHFSHPLKLSRYIINAFHKNSKKAYVIFFLKD